MLFVLHRAGLFRHSYIASKLSWTHPQSILPDMLTTMKQSFSFFILLSCVAHVISAPIKDPEEILSYNKGDIVGVRAEHYQDGVVRGAVPPHPGVVVSDQKPNGNYDIAVMSKKLPYEPPQQDIKDFHPDSTLYGNLALSPPHDIPPDVMKPWISKVTGQVEIPMPHEGLEKLKTAMAPHAGWEAPKPAEGEEPEVSKPKKQRSKKKKNQAEGTVTAGSSFSGGAGPSNAGGAAPQRKGKPSPLTRTAKTVKTSKTSKTAKTINAKAKLAKTANRKVVKTVNAKTSKLAPNRKQAPVKTHSSVRPHAAPVRVHTPPKLVRAKLLHAPAKTHSKATKPQAHPRVLPKGHAVLPKKKAAKSPVRQAQGKRPHRR